MATSKPQKIAGRKRMDARTNRGQTEKHRKRSTIRLLEVSSCFSNAFSTAVLLITDLDISVTLERSSQLPHVLLLIHNFVSKYQHKRLDSDEVGELDDLGRIERAVGDRLLAGNDEE